ncbi:putative calcium dependent mitochondrial carrier protein [Eutypa lata UCREL1]|uniref:Mitochondrial thiamine pyrophosphate carrier 1 n=1 Tax=Eutypa lata (strain UCR-EL1) TaxID=1287681 RepID=M7TS57_EUTLA|nr:putative calcium dependent mitochondrial carrier protein [Eutypa lata UCREL1]
MELAESQNQRDARVEQLWKRLDFQRKGELDWKALQKGLKKIDHPMKNADDMMKEIIKVVDTNGDGKIQYDEFRVFVEAAERQLLLLFKSIDRDQNGKLDKDELYMAFQRSGIAIPMRRLNDFFEDIDHNKDGFITYEEWRIVLYFKFAPQVVVGGYFIAGAVAGGISRTATAPLDRLKVYLLVNTSASTNVAIEAAKKGQPAAALKNAGRPLVSAIAELYKSGGVRGFFAGNGLNVVKIMPETAIRFGAYEAAKRTLADLEGHGDTHHINPYSKFVAGGVAGMVSQFCVYPLDTLKFRLQSEYVSGGARGNTLLLQTFRKMYAEGGARAAYRGVTMGLVGMFPYSAIDMGTFEMLKTTYITYKAKKNGVHEEDALPSTFVTGIMGATSGAFGASVVYPLNVLRTRLQTQGTKMHPARYTGIWDVANKTVRNEGFRGLYKGLMPNLLKVAPALSITWMVYENAKRIMDLH